MSAHFDVFAWKLKLSGWPSWAVCLFCTFEDGKEREIMWTVFALLIYVALSCKLKLKRLDIDVKTHFCSTINLSYLGSWVRLRPRTLRLTGYFQFLNLIPIFSSVQSVLPVKGRRDCQLCCNLMTNYVFPLLVRRHSLFWLDYISWNCFQIKNVLNVKLLGHFCTLIPKHSRSPC